MLICHCKAVNEATIRAAVLAGARDIEGLGRRCGAGTGCGGCAPALLELLAEHHDRRDADPRTSAA